MGKGSRSVEMRRKDSRRKLIARTKRKIATAKAARVKAKKS